jgi:hypothetical protein
MGTKNDNFFDRRGDVRGECFLVVPLIPVRQPIHQGQDFVAEAGAFIPTEAPAVQVGAVHSRAEERGVCQKKGGGGLTAVRPTTCKMKAVVTLTSPIMEGPLPLLGCSFADLLVLAVAFPPSQHPQMVQHWVALNFSASRLQRLTFGQLNGMLTGCPRELSAEVMRLWLEVRGLTRTRISRIN